MFFKIFENNQKQEPQTLSVKVIGPGHDHTDKHLVNHTARVLEIRIAKEFQNYPDAPPLKELPSVKFNKKSGEFRIEKPPFEGDLNRAVFAGVFSKKKFTYAQSVEFTTPNTVEIVFPG